MAGDVGQHLLRMCSTCSALCGRQAWRAWARAPEGGAVFLDVPQPNAAAVALAEGCATAPMFETARMYKGAPLLPDMRRTFGIGTFELGWAAPGLQRISS